MWGIVYLFSGHAKCLLSDKRTTQSRNAIIQKRKNQKQQFYAIIQPMMAKEAENEVTVLRCDETYSTITDDPFNCYLPENKSFKDLAVDDILEAVLF